MPVSQNRDKTRSGAKAGKQPLAQAPQAYQRLHQNFTWQLPQYFNIAQVCCGRWAAQPDAAKRIAVQTYQNGAAGMVHSYAQLQQQANRLSNVLRAQGVARGDRVAIVMPQCMETAIVYMAVLQMGAVAMPLSLLFGPEALEYRLHDSEAVLAICDASALAHLHSVRPACPALRVVLGVGSVPATQGLADANFAQALASHAVRFAAVDTLADDPAVLIYTSGTTGNPKGALLAHRSLIGNLPGFVASQNWFGFDPFAPAAGAAADLPAQCDSVFWSPADWAWTGGLMDALLPTLYFGRPIVAFNGRFSPQTALELMGTCGVTHTFLFPTALKAMMKAFAGSQAHTVRQQFGLRLQAVMSAGEAVGDAVFA